MTLLTAGCASKYAATASAVAEVAVIRLFSVCKPTERQEGA